MERGSAVAEAQQYQCPNCGSYRTSSTVTDVKPATGKPPTGCGVFLIAGLGLVILGVALFLGLAAMGAAGENSETSGAALMIGVGIWGVGLVVVIAISMATTRWRKANLWERRSLTCLTCNCRWKWLTHEPYPQVNVDPALIQQAEAEQRRQGVQRPSGPPPSWLEPGGPLGPPG
jgi:hypothetical protein